MFEQEGGAEFFGEPALDRFDPMRANRDGRGYVKALIADTLSHKPRI